MSETLNNHEKHQETLPSGEHQKLTAEASHENLSQAKAEHGKLKHEAQVAVAELQTDNEASRALEDLKKAENAPAEASHGYVDRELKSITLRRELHSIRRKLPASQRALSQVIHQPVVRAVSEGAAKTVSRPSGLLGGGLVAFLGTMGYYYMASHYGFEYNYFVMLALFAGGFALGLLLELFVFAATASRRVQH